MKQFRILVCLLIFMNFSVVVFAVKAEDIPPWMEDIEESGRSTYLVPVGAKRKVVGSQIIVEPPNEYVARRLYEMQEYLESRFKVIEENQANFLKELDEIRLNIDGLETKNNDTHDLDELKKSIEALNEFKQVMEKSVIIGDLSEDPEKSNEAVEKGEEIIEEEIQ